MNLIYDSFIDVHNFFQTVMGKQRSFYNTFIRQKKSAVETADGLNDCLLYEYDINS